MSGGIRAIVGAAMVALSLCGCASTPRLAVGPIPPGVTVDARLQYYDISAATLGEIRQAIRQQGTRIGGRPYSAVTHWRLSWKYQYNSRDPSRCALHHVRVYVSALVDFPRWTPTAQPDSALLAWWEQFNSGLAEHERGHAVIAVEGGRKIARALDGLSGGACDALGARANAIGRRHVDETRALQDKYDRESRHGQQQILQAIRLRAP
jgi:predicted secreted Zn-dependent protease